jgi:hypothetical protein
MAAPARTVPGKITEDILRRMLYLRTKQLEWILCEIALRQERLQEQDAWIWLVRTGVTPADADVILLEVHNANKAREEHMAPVRATLTQMMHEMDALIGNETVH